MSRAGPEKSGRCRRLQPAARRKSSSFASGQISRMVILGATAENKPLLEQSYLRMLDAFEPHVGMTSYLFGAAVAGRFRLVRAAQRDGDRPTPMRIMREKAPVTDHWVRRLDDASGVEGEWYPRERALGGMAEALLKIAGELYLPFLVANAEAFAKGLERLKIKYLGPAICAGAFEILRSSSCSCYATKFAALDAGEQGRAAAIVKPTGCWEHLAASC